MKKTICCLLILIILLVFAFYLFKPAQAKKIIWGINFSSKHTTHLGLDWKETYLALLDDLKARNLKIAFHWDLIEPERNQYFFNDLDWQVEEAKKRGASIVPVIGIKTSRWPECHIPQWAKSLDQEEQQQTVLDLIEQIVTRYKGEENIKAWQVENEPLFAFGTCPWVDEDFLKKEINLVKSIDGLNRPIIISDSGEVSFWVAAAKLGDMVGVTLYRTVWSDEFKIYFDYPLPPSYYWLKAKIIEKLLKKKVICVELQVEPWGPNKLIYDSSLEEQNKTMNLDKFKKNIKYAERTGFDEFYLWGDEWWYWMKVKHNNSEIWDEAKKLFVE